jgi:hypothetical protein
MIKKKLENDIQNEIFDFLLKENYFFWRSNNVPVFGKNNGGKYMYRKLPKHTPKGLPDICVVHNGEFIAVEVKRDGCHLTEDQALFGEKVMCANAWYYCVHSVDELKEKYPFNKSA